jgi:hypothetical protein
MLEIPVDDLIFLVCTIVGGGLLLVTVLVDDILGGILDVLHIDFDIGGVSLMPLLLGAGPGLLGQRVGWPELAPRGRIVSLLQRPALEPAASPLGRANAYRGEPS